MDTADKVRIAMIRHLNDRFRVYGNGCGSLMVTSGIRAEGADFVASAIAEVRRFTAFTSDNDPYGERDFGAFALQGKRLFFKIDYYDHALIGHSPDPANETVTHRVLTIMLASEY